MLINLLGSREMRCTSVCPSNVVEMLCRAFCREGVEQLGNNLIIKCIVGGTE